MTQPVRNPFPLYLDARGRPLTGGKVYVGVAGMDPELHPIDVFFDQALTIAAPQPINTIGGVTVRSGNPSLIYVAQNNFSIRVRDADGAEVFYLASALIDGQLFQPLDSDLTAIAALSTTSFGRSLLTQASAAAARSTLGIVAPLPIAGGAMQGEITRNGAGAYPYLADASIGVGRIFITENGAADPRTQPGDIWFEEAP